jgi:uncharacterized protein (DUF2141 family)
MHMPSPSKRFGPVACVAASLLLAGVAPLDAQNVKRVVKSAINAAEKQAGGAQQGQGRAGGRQAGQGAGQAQGQAGQPGQARDAVGQQQQAAVGTATISGTVVAEGAGTPVRKARVTLTAPELRGRSRVITTDDQGRFSFVALPAGRYAITASKAGYVDIRYGAKKPGRPGTQIQLADGQKFDRANMNLPKGSVITGIVIDENGEPAPSTPVRAYRYVMSTGEKTLQQAGSATTDDRGIYRIFALQPGDYVVSAAPRNNGLGDVAQTMMAQIETLVQQAQAAGGRGGGGGGGGGRGGGGAGGGLGAAIAGMGNGRGAQQLMDQAAMLQQQLQQANGGDQQTAYAPVFYPGTTSPSSATTVTLAIGEERPGVDFQMQLVPVAKIDGMLIGPDGTVPPGSQIRLVSKEQGPGMPGMGPNMARVDQAGKFSFANVAPGQYTLMASAQLRQPQQPDANGVVAAQPLGRGRGGPGGGPGGRGGTPTQVLWAAADVTVSGQNIADVVMNLQQGMALSGRVAFEASTLQPPTDLTTVRVMLQQQGQAGEAPPPPPAQVDAQGRFTFVGVIPGKYSLRANVGGAGRGGAFGTQNAATPAAQTGGRGGGAGTAGATQAAQPAANWSLKSAVVGGHDVLDFPLDLKPNEQITDAVLTFSDKSQELSGTLQDAQGRPTSDFTIIIFPADNRYWVPQARRIQSSRPSTDGKFSFRNLPAGEYRLTAVTDAETGEWYDPSFLSQLVNVSMAISLRDGEKKVQDIKLAGGL